MRRGPPFRNTLWRRGNGRRTATGGMGGAVRFKALVFRCSRNKRITKRSEADETMPQMRRTLE